jgi:hypothetical protein
VLPQLELVDGAHCHVVKVGTQQKIWIDPMIGFAVRFCEFYRWSPIPLKLVLSYQCVQRDFRCHRDDIWLPWRLEYLSFEANRAGFMSSGIRSRFSIDEVQKLAVNGDVSDNLFNMQYPHGTTVCDSVNRKFYRIGDNGEEIKLGDWE